MILTKKNSNYISKCMDLHFCLERYIDTKIKNNENVYLMDLNSFETDRTVFTQKIWKQFQSRLNNQRNKYKVHDGVGALEKDHNGNYHVHMLFTYTSNYSTTSVYNLNTNLRRLWLSLNSKYSGKVLHAKRFAVSPLNISAKNKLTRYLAKPIKHRIGKNAYLPKDYSTQGSFRVVLGKATTLWDAKELPSWKYSNETLAKQLKSICNETKYSMNELHLLQKEDQRYLSKYTNLKNLYCTHFNATENYDVLG